MINAIKTTKNSIKTKEVKYMCFKFLKKTIAICLIGLGTGILAVLLLPLSWWLFIFGLGRVVCGFACISC